MSSGQVQCVAITSPSFGDIYGGAEVLVWSNGYVLESLPAQVEAVRILVRNFEKVTTSPAR